MGMDRKKTPFLSVLFSVMLLLCSCDSREREDGPLVRISAAVSLAEALEEITGLYLEKRDVSFQLNFASSSSCARQIEQGMDVDIFLSANDIWMDFVEERVHTESRKDLLSNSLVVVLPLESSLVLEKPEDLLSIGIKKIAMGDPSHVPAGIYGKEALSKSGLWNSLEDRIVGALDVRAALNLAASGAVDCAIVYKSDALVEKRVRVAFYFPPEKASPVLYQSCRIGESAEADLFYSFLHGKEAARIFSKYGFSSIKDTEE